MGCPYWVSAAMVAVSLGHGGGIAYGQYVPTVGTKVVTRYRGPLSVGDQIVDNGTTLRIYEVHQIDGDRLKLVANNVRG